jgi:type II secretory pathway component PulF
MPNVYSYRARDMSGKVVRGQIQADDMNRAAELIRSRRMVILELAPGRTRKKEFPLFSKRRPFPLRNLQFFAGRCPP